MKKSFRKLLAMVLSLAMTLTCFAVPMKAEAAGTEKEPLKFGADGKFKIIIFSDAQDQYPVHAALTNRMRLAMQRENPDFVVFTGDQTEINTKDPEVDFRRTIEQILAPVVDAGVPYAFVYGNHDTQFHEGLGKGSMEALLAVYQSIGDCRTTDPAPELTGTGTCKIPIYSSNGNELAFNLWMIDSGSYQNPTDGKSGYDNPHEDQLAWMKENNDAGVNSLAFQHIPMPEMYEFIVEDANGSHSYGGKKYKLELNDKASGSLGEFPHPIYAEDNRGEFDTFKEMGNVLGLFTGHDHLNDFTGVLDGIKLTAVPGMSYFNYGKEDVRGYGVIELDESDLSTYDYHSVKFTTLDEEAGTSSEVVYDTYDEITYSDLKENGNKLGAEYTLSGGHTFTYDATSPSKSAIFKFRWTAGTKPGFQFSYDIGADGNISHPFGVWIKRADQVPPNGTWHLKPNLESYAVNMTKAVAQGETYDIEFGRLKVLSGDPKNVGSYYVYLKVNGVLIQEGYSNTDEEGGYISGSAECKISNEIRFGAWGNNKDDKISDIPVVEEYYDYDEITFDDLYLDGTSMNGMEIEGGDRKYTYNATSPSYSMKLKFRWTAGATARFTAYLDDWVFPFCFAVKEPGRSDFGAAAGENGAWHLVPSNNDSIIQMDEPIAEGTVYDMEIGRLKVKNGPNEGKYLVYWKANDELIQSYYYDGVNADGTYGSGTALSNKIIISSPEGNKFAAKPEPESYEAYDEITFDDLYIDGTSMNGMEIEGGDRKYTYNATSPSYSMKLKFQWTAGATARFTAYLDDWVFPFCFAVKEPGRSDFGAEAGENGAWHLVPSNNSMIVQMDEPIAEGTVYDMEIGRLKVKNGANKGKYLVYWKANDELIQSYYYDGVVDGTYGNGTTLSNKIIISSKEGNKFAAKPVEETYEDYDDLTFNDLLADGASVSGMEIDGGKTYTYNATSSSFSMKLKYRWVAGGDEMKFTVFLDDWKYPFCFAAKTPNQEGFGEKAGPNGAWHLVPSDSSLIVQMDEPIVAGQAYDVEIGRLKVKTGINKGKYLVYWKVNDELIQSYYYGGVSNGVYENVSLSNKIIVSAPAGNKFSASPSQGETPEEPGGDTDPDSIYEPYDEIGFDSLYIDGESMAGREMDGSHDYTYTATSPTYSVKFKYRWIPGGNGLKFSTYFDAWKYPFCFAVKTPNQGDFGKQAGPNGAWHLVPSNGDLMVDMDEPIVAGQPYDIEIGRLKVKSGEHAGKYYVYYMVNGEMIQSYYYEGVSNGMYEGVSLSNKIIISAPAGNKFTAVPYVQEYEAYDEVGFEDLKDADGNALGTEKQMAGATVLTYDKTSPTGSVIFKYRWKIGSVPKFQMSFEKAASDTMAYLFGAWLAAPGEEASYPNGRMWLRPAYGPQADMGEALVAGSSHNVEFARLKVANGPNKGKYYVYIKIDDVLIAEDYVAANVVDSSGYYTTDPGSKYLALSNEIFFAYWGSEGNVISTYREPGADDHEGIRGDFDRNGIVDVNDFTLFKAILIGAEDGSDLPEGTADFNGNGKETLGDFMAMKKTFSASNEYAKAGSLTLGMQEHMNEDATKTAEYIADATVAMGATAYRLSEPIHNLYYATSSNGVAVKEEKMAAFEEMVAALKAKGITEILYVTDSFILPYEYSDPDKNHNKTVPDPIDDPVHYEAWLKVNAAAFKELAKKFPEIKFFEPFNEINVTGSRLEMPGIGWNATDAEKKAHRYSVKEKAGIMADLCWYVTEAVKSVNKDNQVTTPSIAASASSVVENDFLAEFYSAIESGHYPTGQKVADARIDNYFTIVNIHAYPDYADKTSTYQENVNAYASRMQAIYEVMKAHNDGGSRVWLTETGVSSYHGNGASRNEDTAAAIATCALEKIDTELTFIDAVFMYKLADISSDVNASKVEAGYGLFYSGDDLDHDPYAAKPIAKAVYSYFHNGTTDYSELDELVEKYAF